jgi:chemotaxis protein MotB
MMRARPQSRVSHDRWLVSYADFITLLFAFFVVLYAFAKADQKKQAQVSAVHRHRLPLPGHLSRRRARPSARPAPPPAPTNPVMPMNIVMGEDVLAPAQVKDDLEQTSPRAQQTLSNQVAQHTVSIQMGRDGLVISLREAGFFDSGSATPKPETLPTLRQIAARSGRTPTTCASRATPTTSPSTPPNSIPTGSSPRPAPPASPASSST